MEESTGIYVSLGSPTNRMARVLAQADAWFEKHGHVVKKTIGTPEERGFVNHQEIADAVASAASDVAVDLEEAIVLKETCAKMKDWSERASFAAPKRSKRMGKSKLATKVVRYRVNDLVQLIEEADDLPADTREEVDRLKRQLNDVHTWRIKAHGDLKGLIGGFKALASAIEVKYGSEADFQCGDSKDNENEDGSSLNDPIGGDSDVKSKNRSQTSGDNAMDTSDNDSKGDDSDVQLGTRGNSNVIKSIESLLSEGKQSGVLTTEEELASDLQEVSKWCFKSLKFLERPRDLYEKRAHRAFDTFVKAGGELVDAQRSRHLDDSELEGDLKSSWMAVVSSQLVRLRKLQAHRDEFSEWSKKAHPLISSKEKRLSLKAIQDLAQESHRFPASKYL